MATLIATTVAFAPTAAEAAVASSGFINRFTGRRASDGQVSFAATEVAWAPVAAQVTVIPHARPFVPFVGLNGTTGGYSLNGSAWTATSQPNNTQWPWNALMFNGSRYIATTWGANGNPNATYSVDGLTWFPLTSLGTPNKAWSRIAWNGIVHVVVGGNTGTGGGAYSYDGLNWAASNMPTVGSVSGQGFYWEDVAWNGSVWCAVQSYNGTTRTNHCATSSDGINWTARSMPEAARWKTITWNGSLFVATRNEATASYATSPDGVTWTARAFPVAMIVLGVCWNGSILVALNATAGATVAYTSPDGINWTARTIPAGSWYRIAWNGSLFFAGTDTTAGATSPDGITWTSVTTNTSFGSFGAVVGIDIYTLTLTSPPELVVSNLTSTPSMSTIAVVVPHTIDLAVPNITSAPSMSTAAVTVTPRFELSTDFMSWLRNPVAVRIVLIEAVAMVDGVETTRYMSNHGWKSGPDDEPPNTHYEPIAQSGIQFTEQLSLTGSQVSLSTGDVEIDNLNGIRESWLDDIWTGRTVKAWIGDERWSRAAFQPIFDGVMAPIARKSDTKLALKLRDKLKRLDGAMTEVKLGGTSPNADSIIPLCFGECHNVTPLLVDPALLKYQVHNGPIEGIIEVRVNGQPVAFAEDVETGTFVLIRQPAGIVTCSVWGDKFGGAYRNTVSALIRRIVTGFGKDTDRFTTDDLDLANMDTFEGENQQAVGLYISDRTNVLIACQMLASTLAAQVSMTRLGLMQLLKVRIPAFGVPRDVYQHEFIANTLLPNTCVDPVAAVKLNFCKNWTTEKGLQTDIPAEALALFASDWLSVSSVDEDVKTDHKLSGDVIATDTMMIDQAEAQAECDSRLLFAKVPHVAYEGDGFPELLELRLGQAITVYNDRYSMSEGVDAIVMRLTPDWENCHVKVGFLV